MDAVTLQPAAGAHGELTGILLVRAALEAQRQSAQEESSSRIRRTAPIRRRCAMAGYEVVEHRVERSRHAGRRKRWRVWWTKTSPR